MAESTIVHFASVGWEELTFWLDARAACNRFRHWSYPTQLESTLYLYEYADHQCEFEPADLKWLCNKLGGFPSAALCLQLCRSAGDRASDAAVALTLELLRAFNGIADDTYADAIEGYWSLKEIESGVIRPHGGFLDCYREVR